MQKVPLHRTYRSLLLSGVPLLMLLLLPSTGCTPVPPDEKETAVEQQTWKRNLQHDRFQEVFDLVKQGIKEQVAPGMVVYVAREGHILVEKGFGHHTYQSDAPRVTEHTIFDQASMTKVVATVPLTMRFYEKGWIELDDPVSTYVPTFSGKIKEEVTIRHLLTHTSGIKPWVKLWKKVDRSEQVIPYIVNLPLQHEPGTAYAYSDLGFILLGHILEQVGGKPLDQLAREQLFQPLGMDDTMFNPSKSVRSRIAPTEAGNSYRDRLIRGNVHDGNAYFLGGVAGHAGLFSTADDLGRYGQMLLENGRYGGEQHIRPDTIETFTSRQHIVKDSTRALGWDTPRSENSLYGTHVSDRAFGHTGFTGTSIVVDPVYDVIVILLTNRVYPDRNNEKIDDFRPRFHNLVMQELLTNSSQINGK